MARLLPYLKERLSSKPSEITEFFEVQELTKALSRVNCDSLQDGGQTKDLLNSILADLNSASSEILDKTEVNMTALANELTLAAKSQGREYNTFYRSRVPFLLQGVPKATL